MELGGLLGLAVKQDRSDDIENIKYLDGLRKQNDAINMAKAKMFMDDIEFQNGSNAYDEARIRKESNAIIQQLSDLKKAHPHDYLSNIEVQLQAKQLKAAMKATPGVIGSLAYKEAQAQHNKFMQEALKNPTKYNTDQLSEAQKKFDNYGKPESLAARGLTEEPPMYYTPPEEIPDMEDMHRKAGDSMDADEYTDLKNGRDGAFKGRVSDKTMTAKAQELYSQHKSAYDYLYKNVPDKISAIKAAIEPYSKKPYEIGERNALADQKELIRFKASLEQPPVQGVSPYVEQVLKPARAFPGADYLAQTFTTDIPNTYTDINGKTIQNKNDQFYYDGDIIDDGYNPKGYTKTGIKVVPGFIKKDLAWGEDQGYLYDPIGRSGQEGTDLEVKPEHKGKVEIVRTEPDKDGKVGLYLKIKAVGKVDANKPAYKNRFDSGVAKLTGKQKDAAGVLKSALENGREYQEDAEGNRYYKGIDY